MLVSDAMTPDPVTVSSSTSLRDAVTALADHRVSALPVVDADRVVRGIVSEADLLPGAFPPDRRTHLIPPPPAPAPTPDSRTVADVMTSPAATVHLGDDAAEVVQLMTDRGFKSVPVVDPSGVLLGIVSRSDLVRVRARDDRAIARDVSTLFHDLLPPRWAIEVTNGVVVVRGLQGTEQAALAEAGAAAIPGVVQVRVELG